MGDDDAYLLEHYTRTRSEMGEHRFEVCVVTWDGPHTAVGTWVEAKRMPEGTTS
jgi:hypothetical protein